MFSTASLLCEPAEAADFEVNVGCDFLENEKFYAAVGPILSSMDGGCHRGEVEGRP